MFTENNLDVIIIGGSYAGLSAAMALGRSLRKVLIIDSGQPCNKQTPHSHNFITQDGTTPAEISEKAKEQVLRYSSVKIIKGNAVIGWRTDPGFGIATDSGEKFQASKIIFASGIKDQMPDIKGFAECWGISVVHCPYCHGYEIRGKKTAILAQGEKALHIASLVNNLTDKITLITSGSADFDIEKIKTLNRHNINLVEKKVIEIKQQAGQIEYLVFEDGSQEQFDAMYAAIPFVQHCNIPADLGCEITDDGYIKTDQFQKTTVPGVFACGDNCARMRSVANAVASGNLVGAIVNMELTQESF